LINLIWDIDGTLLTTKGKGVVPFCEAFTEVTGKPANIDRKKFSGFTDFEIVLSLMDDVGIERNFVLAEEILDAFSNSLQVVLSHSPPEILGAIEETLKFTDLSPKYTNSIGSGNFYKGAVVKLQKANLYQYFASSEFFVASKDYWNRDAIIHCAAKFCADSPSLVIGDSPRDISSARASGLLVLAVATGQHGFEELLELNPDYILRTGWNLEDFKEALQSLKLE
jgi:phosphoglycolate phosphatase-like HAD superfamily hydrolase